MSQLQLQGLGRPFCLGMLYDCRTDELVPGIKLWSSDTLSKAIQTVNQERSEHEIITDDSINKKTIHLKLDGDLKLSVLSGLVKVGGSAKYLHDRVSSERQARVTLMYTSESKFEELSMHQLRRIEYDDAIKQNSATHVVTGIQFGVDAFFIFDQVLKDKQGLHDAHGLMEAKIKCLPSIALDVGGEAGLKIESKKVDQSENFQCKFYGDFKFSKNPSTFQEVISIYRDLPRIVAECDPVPKRVWLYPLHKLDSRANKVLREIKIRVISEVEKMLEGFQELEVRCNDLCNVDTVRRFRDIQIQIKEFHRVLNTHRLDIMKEIGDLLPSVRCRDAEETELIDIIKRNQNSEYILSQPSFDSWINRKMKEIKALEGLQSSLKQVQFVSSSNGDLDELLNEVSYDILYCFSVNIEDRSDTRLEEMRKCLHAQTVKTCESATPMKRDLKAIGKLRDRIKMFRNIAGDNAESTNTKCIVTDSIKDIYELSEFEEDSAVILMYKNAQVNVVQISKPRNVSVIGDPTHSSVKLRWTSPEFEANAVSRYSIVGCCTNQKSTNWIEQSVTDVKSDKGTHEITVVALVPDTRYCFKVQPVSSSDHCVGMASDGIQAKTKPVTAGKPGQPTKTQVSFNSISVKWSKPTYKGSHGVIKSYKLYYKIKDSEVWNEVDNLSGKERATVPGLAPNLAYVFKVRAITDGGLGEESEKSEPIQTLPTPAQQLRRKSKEISPRPLDELISYKT